MPADARAILIDALHAPRRWLDELLSDARVTLESLASREGRTVRSIRMTLSLAFLAPEIVKAAVEGRLPRGADPFHPGTGPSVEVRTPRAVRNRARWTCGKQQPWKRKFAARDFRPHTPPMSHGDGRKTQQTDCCRRKPRECRTILWRRKSCHDVQTTWWS